MGKRIIIYCRVSTEEQTTENQRLTLIKYAESKGWDYEVFEEKESTRKTRPIKTHVLDLLRKRKFKGVLIYKLDRWARSLDELITEIEELHKKKIDFYSYSDNLDLDTASGKLHFQILGAFAEFERALISQRTKEGMKRAKAQGKKIGRPKKSIEEYPHVCGFPGCRIRIKKNRGLCYKHKKQIGIVQKKGRFKE